jgi:hypothetical protein
MELKRHQTDSRVTFLAVVGTVIYVGLIAREFVHLALGAPWPGFRVGFNLPMLIVSVSFWILGSMALWLPKTAISRLIAMLGVLATFAHGLVLRSSSAEASVEGLVNIAFAAILAFVTLGDLNRRRAADGSYLPGQEAPLPPEVVKDEEEPEPPIDEHRLVG